LLCIFTLPRDIYILLNNIVQLLDFIIGFCDINVACIFTLPRNIYFILNIIVQLWGFRLYNNTFNDFNVIFYVCHYITSLIGNKLVSFIILVMQACRKNNCVCILCMYYLLKIKRYNKCIYYVYYWCTKPTAEGPHKTNLVTFLCIMKGSRY
jgi:hypothetical protein